MEDRDFLRDQDVNFQSVDFVKLSSVFRRKLVWLLFIFVFINSIAYLYIRYTKPLYSSESILKLDFKNDAGLLGLQNPLDQDIKDISGEIEILKSKLFLTRVINSVGLQVSYYFEGRSYMVDERYDNSPFVIHVDSMVQLMKDRKVYIDIINDQEYTLQYELHGEDVSFSGRFGEGYKNDQISFKVEKTTYFEEQKEYRDFYFVINSEDALLAYFENNMTVEPINLNANTIKISLRDFNAEKAHSILSAIDTIYLLYTEEAKNRTLKQKIEFVENQMVKTSHELEAYEDYFEQFTISNRTTDLSADLSKTIEHLYRLDSQKINVRKSANELDMVLKQLKSNELISISSKSFPAYSFINNYNELLSERFVKIKIYNEHSQIISNLDHQIFVAKKHLIDVLSKQQIDLSDLLADLQRKRKMLEDNFLELPAMGTAYNKQRRHYALQEEFYISLIQSKIELEIAQAGSVTDFVILSTASEPSDPIHPKKFLIYLLSIVLSFIICFLFVGVSYLIHNEVQGLKELERLTNVPILGAVPRYIEEKLSITKLIVSKNPKSPISEALRSLRTNMEFLSGRGSNKIFSITSTVSGEGKTFIAANLGAIFAYSGQKVVIVDLDMRKPKVHLAFEEVATDKGVSTILINKHSVEESICSSSVERLHFIPAGPIPPNPSELILTNEFDEMLESLKEQFDIIFLDTPPVGLVTDGVLVMQKSDLQLYVLRSEYSKKVYLQSVNRLFERNNFTKMSIIFNSVESQSNSYGYGYGYGEGSGYYSESSDKPKSFWRGVFKV